MHKKYLLIILIIFYFTVPGNASQYPNADKLEKIFKTYLPDNIIYTKVPRGLVISVDEKIFFNYGEVKIKQSSLKILDTIAGIIKNLPNKFVIENHTTEAFSNFQQWELSVIRASNLAQYFINYHEFPGDKITSIGLGKTVPYRYNKSEINFNTDNRIDFVIIEYETMR